MPFVLQGRPSTLESACQAYVELLQILHRSLSHVGIGTTGAAVTSPSPHRLTTVQRIINGASVLFYAAKQRHSLSRYLVYCDPPFSGYI